VGSLPAATPIDILQNLDDLCTDLDLTLFFVLILKTYSFISPNLQGNKIDSAWRLLPAALLERWPPVCHTKINFELLPTN